MDYEFVIPNTKVVPIEEVKVNPENPRTISKQKFKELVASIKHAPWMLGYRPIVVNSDSVVLGGNMRLRACQDAGLKKVPIINGDELTSDQIREFIIKDNVAFGDWDWDILANQWEIEDLKDWGLKVPTVKDTELLSGLEYKEVYYEPERIPDLKLMECINFEKFEAKVAALDEYKLTKKQKEVLKWFAYRFLKIDFEWVANYYHFQATEEEKKAMERLRLVLTDSGLNGFVQDDLLRILNFTDQDMPND